MGVLIGWRFCPRCGLPVTPEEDRVQCESCGFVHYANSVPAVSALVVDDERCVLLARRAVEPDLGLWDTPGGFLEEGEEPIVALRRELLEETGLTIEIGDFVGMFTDRYGDGATAPSVLNLVWEVRIAGGAPRAADDVSELRWFAPAALPEESELAFRWLGPCLREWSASGDR
ncbi:MAG: NUDIX domain-containing protein [Gaiellaceae bacterium]